MKPRLSRRNLKAKAKHEEEALISRQSKVQTRETKSKNVIRKRTKLTCSGPEKETEVIDLATRRDVVNKTIFRILRRFLTQEFKAFVPIQQEDKNSKREKFFN